MEFRNGVKMRKDNEKPGPSGMSRNEAFSMPEAWDGRNCLLPIDRKVIREMKEQLGGPTFLEFVSPEFAEHAQEVYDSIGVGDGLTQENVWMVFESMLPLCFPAM